MQKQGNVVKSYVIAFYTFMYRLRTSYNIYGMAASTNKIHTF